MAKRRFEIHLTLSSEMHVEALLEHARAFSLTPTFVRLASGASAHQPMLTARVEGDLADARAHACVLARKLAAQGIAVTRTKIEVERAGVPLMGCGYIEHHVKVDVAEGQLDALRALCLREHAHLSSNALASLSAGRVLVFCTQRILDPQNTAHADRALASLLHALGELAGCVVRDIENEHVLEDSNQALDAGWMT